MAVASNARGWAFSKKLYHTRDPFRAIPSRVAALHLNLSIVIYAPEIRPISGSGVFELPDESNALDCA
jgi:hypothetical protein